MCARVEGLDDDGKTQLGNFREIGAVWAPGKDGKWLPVNLDLTPHELTGGNARLFLAEVAD